MGWLGSRLTIKEVFMVKSLLFIAVLLLSGCYHHIWVDAVQPYKVSGGQIARGTNPPISWVCQQQETNPVLVWVECTFRNDWDVRSDNLSKRSTCIRINYFTNNGGPTHYLIAFSKVLCSGDLGAEEESKNYVSFTGIDRELLTNRCGVYLTNCIMLAEKDQ